MIQDRAAGAVMGALIGDALGLGCHWYYDLDELHRDYGAWITGYTTPRPDRYHGGMQAGQLSQTGLILVMLLRSVVAHGEYSEDDFTRRLDEELFPLLDGTPVYGPGGYTNQSMREAWRRRVKQHMSWQETGGPRGHHRVGRTRHRAGGALRKTAATTSPNPWLSNCRLTQGDEAIVAMTTAYNCVLSQSGCRREADAGHFGQAHATGPQRGTAVPHRDEKQFLRSQVAATRTRHARAVLVPDALLTPHYAALAALDPDIQIEPAWKVVHRVRHAMRHLSPVTGGVLPCQPVRG